MTLFPLRGYGPRVFISYCFEDAALAESLEKALKRAGCQVTREDERSLMGLKLTDAIPKRIAQAEVLIQILTTAANQSGWVAQEFDYAVELKEKHHGIVILPVVFDERSLRPSVARWWYFKAAGDSLSEEALAEIEGFCLKSVHLLPLDAADPFALSKPEAEKALRELPGDDKRVIVDAAGSLLRWTRDSLDQIEVSDTPYRDQLEEQETGRFERLIRRYKAIDEIVRKLAIEVMGHMTSYSSPEDHIEDALRPLQLFARVVIGHDLLNAADMAPAVHPLRDEYGPIIERARAACSKNYSRDFLNPGFYAWAFGGQDAEGDLLLMRMESKDFAPIRLMMPRRVFDQMANFYAGGVVFNPVRELLPGTFINYVLPQIAVEAAFHLAASANIRAALDGEYAWRLDQYSVMGVI